MPATGEYRLLVSCEGNCDESAEFVHTSRQAAVAVARDNGWHIDSHNGLIVFCGACVADASRHKAVRPVTYSPKRIARIGT